MAVVPAGQHSAPQRQPCEHLIQAYTEDVFLVGVVADYVGSGLARGEGSVIIATPLHVEAFADRLAAAGIDVSKAIEKNQLMFLDAERTLARFMVDGMPDHSKFFPII